MKAIGYPNFFSLLRYSLRKWWYRIVSTTFLRKIPFIRKQRIKYFRETKEFLYLLEGTLKFLKENNLYPKYTLKFNSNHKGHEQEHKFTKYSSSKEHTDV